VRLYEELAEWWPLLSAPASYAEEAEIFRSAIEATATAPVRTVLELGSGGGNNASHLKARWRLTLSDRSPGMIAVSERLNPECEHVVGDMRTLRLGRTFDAVFVHDAVMYLATEADLRAAVATARAHLSPGGLALFVPDDTKETWRSVTSHGGHDGNGRSLRYLQWSYDADPDDDEFVVAMAFLLREGDAPPRVERDLHREGLFSRGTWLSILDDAGFSPKTLPFRHSSFAPDAGRELFLGVAR
jgi:SAM-dependent methyltransferase